MIETISHPWQNKVDYLKLAFWFVIFIIVASIIYDTLRIVATFAVETASEAVS